MTDTTEIPFADEAFPAYLAGDEFFCYGAHAIDSDEKALWYLNPNHTPRLVFKVETLPDPNWYDPIVTKPYRGYKHDWRLTVMSGYMHDPETLSTVGTPRTYKHVDSLVETLHEFAAMYSGGVQ